MNCIAIYVEPRYTYRSSSKHSDDKRPKKGEYKVNPNTEEFEEDLVGSRTNLTPYGMRAWRSGKSAEHNSKLFWGSSLVSVAYYLWIRA